MKGLCNLGENVLRKVKMGSNESDITNSPEGLESKPREIVSTKTINHQRIRILITVNINKDNDRLAAIIILWYI